MKKNILLLLISFILAETSFGSCPEPPNNFFDPTIAPFRLLIVREIPTVVAPWQALATKGRIYFTLNFNDVDGIGLDSSSESFICDSLELPYNFGAKDYSSIPEGTYKAWVRSDGGRKRIQLINVPNRSCIQIHSGNSTNEIKGCILLGDKGFLLGEQSLIQDKSGNWFKAVPVQMQDGSWVRKQGEEVNPDDYIGVINGVPMVWNSKHSFRKIWRLYGTYTSRIIEIKIVNRYPADSMSEITDDIMPPMNLRLLNQ